MSTNIYSSSHTPCKSKRRPYNTRNIVEAKVADKLAEVGPVISFEWHNLTHHFTQSQLELLFNDYIYKRLKLDNNLIFVPPNEFRRHANRYGWKQRQIQSEKFKDRWVNFPY